MAHDRLASATARHCYVGSLKVLLLITRPTTSVSLRYRQQSRHRSPLATWPNSAILRHLAAFDTEQDEARHKEETSVGL
jgi:hypothetical protein